MADTLNLDYPAAGQLLNALDNIHEIKGELKDVPRVIEHLEKTLADSLAEKLRSFRDSFARCISLYGSDHPFFIAAKASRLSYMHERIYQDAEMLTDIRPIFNEDGTKVIEMVITHSLVVSSYKDSWSEVAHFAMDGTDVLRLRDWCDRAIKKASALKLGMAECQWGVRVLNESDEQA